MGAIMATGLLDAGGRNATVGLKSRSGYFRRTAVIGIAVFLQYWCATPGALPYSNDTSDTLQACCGTRGLAPPVACWGAPPASCTPVHALLTTSAGGFAAALACCSRDRLHTR